MLTEAEKTHIALQEKYRAEIAQQFSPKPKKPILESLTKVLQALAIIIGIWATYNEFRKYNQERIDMIEKEARQARRDFSRIFYTQQLEYYSEAAEVTAILANEEPGSTDYQTAQKKFYRLYWGRLSMVEDKFVEKRMVQFEQLLRCYEKRCTEDSLWDADAERWIMAGDVSQRHLRAASLRLASDARLHTLNTWIDSSERANYNRIK